MASSTKDGLTIDTLTVKSTSNLNGNAIVKGNLTVGDSTTGLFSTLSVSGDLTLNKVKVSGFSTKIPNSELKVSDQELLPTQNAVKTYVDTGLATKANLGGSETQDFQAKALTVAGPLTLQGVGVNQFSTDSNMGDSDQVLPTQKAVKTYVDGGLNAKAASGGSETQDFKAKALTVKEGGTFNDIAVGTNPPGVLLPYPYETISTIENTRNLRFYTNTAFFHTGRSSEPTASIDGNGNLSVTGNLTVNGKVILGEVTDLLTTVKDLQSKKLNREGDTINGTLNITVGNFWEGNLTGIRLTSPDHQFFLDVETVCIAGGIVGFEFNPGVGPTTSYKGLKIETGGKVFVQGSRVWPKIKVYSNQTVKNSGVHKEGKWEKDLSDDFSEVCDCFVMLQGFSLWDDFRPGELRHVKSDMAIPQMAYVKVTHYDKKVEVVGYCSESSKDAEDDNTVMFTLVVVGV